MRVIVVLAILTLALLGTIFIGDGGEPSFDERYNRTEKRIQELSADIERDLVEPNEPPE